MSVFHWLLEWREPTRWIAYLAPGVTSHVGRRWRRARSGEPAARRPSLLDRCATLANRIGEAGVAEALLVVVRMEAAGKEGRNTRALEVKDREIAELKRQISESDSSPESPSPSPTGANPTTSASPPRRSRNGP